MPIDRTQALERLKGLNEISEEERRQFMLDNEEKLRQYANRPRLKNRAAEILYNNNKFRNTFGEDAFNSMNDGSEESYNLRNQLLKEKVISDAFNKEFSPFDDKGNRDNSVGLGENFEKYNGLSLDAKEKLLRSDYKTPSQLEEEMKKTRGWARLVNPLLDFVAGEGIMQHKREANQQILNKIYSDNADKASSDHDKEIAHVYLNNPEVTGRNDDDTKDKFAKAIIPGSYVDENGNANRGVSAYAANYGTGKEGEVSDAMKNFSIDEMRKFLAKKYVLDRTLSPDLAATALDNEAQRYIKNHQSDMERLGLFFKDLGISTASYTVDKVNGIANLVRMAEDKISGMPTVYIDDQGQVIDANKTQLTPDNQGNLTYTDNNGTVHTVTQQQVARTTLHNLGKNYDGSENESILNPVFWTRAEQFGTLDKDEQQQYEKLGASPYQVMWDPGEDSNLWYESFKMTSFVLADALSTMIPFGIGAAGKALSTAGKVGQVTRGLGSALNWAGRGLSSQTAFGQIAQGTAGALGIAYAYQRGAFQETLAQNLANAEEALVDRSKHEIYDKYNSDAQYKANIDNLIKLRANDLKNQWIAQNGENALNNIVNPERFNQEINAQAQQEVLGELVNQKFDEIKASKEYAALQNEAIDSAGDAATASFLPEAIKYGFVNTMGFRKWMYQNPTQLAQKTFKGIKEVTTAEGRKRLANQTSFATMKDKAKHIGKVAASQFWGGAWTNGTDDMMVDAAERINQDSYQQYLDNYSKGESMADVYGFIDGIYSYWKGLQNSMGQGTTLNATLVGGVGSIVSAGPNMANIASLATREGRQAYRDNFQRRIARDENGVAKVDENGNPVMENISAKENWRDRMAFFIQNGVLSEYYGAKQSEREAQNHADYVNSILDYYQDFEAIEDLVNSTVLEENAEDVTDKKTMRFVNAINAMDALSHLADSEVEPGSLSSVVKEKLSFIQRASQMDSENAKNPFSEQEISNMLSEYYSANPNLAQNEQNNQLALQHIARNAKKFMEAYDAYNKAEEEVQKAEKEYGKPFDYGVRKKMKLQQALDGHWRKRFSTMAEELGVSNNIYEEIADENIIPSVGGRKNAERLITVYDKQEEQLKDELEKQKKFTQKAQENYDKALEANKKAKTSDEKYNTQVALAFNYQELENAKLQEDHIQQIIDKTVLKRQKIKVSLEALQEGSPVKVIQADEIMSLDPATRAKMMNVENRKLYSKEQVAEIEKLEKRLDTEDKSKLQKIQDLARLAERVKANEEAYSRLSRNPEAAAIQVESERKQAALTAHQLITRNNAITLADVVNQMSDASKRGDIGEQETKENVYALLRKYNSGILNLIKKENMLPDYTSEIDRAISWRETAEDVSSAIASVAKTKENSKDWEDNIRRNIAPIVENATTREEILAELDQAIQDTSDTQAASDIKEIRDFMEKLGYQKSNVTIENAQEKAQREAKQKQKNEEEKKKVEESAKNALEEAVQRANENPENIDEGSELEDVELPSEVNNEIADGEKPKEPEKQEEKKSDETPKTEISEQSYIVEDEDTVQGSTLTAEEEIQQRPDIAVQAPIMPSEADNNSVSDSPGRPILSGNAMSEWVPDLIEDFGILKHKVGNEPNDAMNKYFAWMEAHGIKLQNIIDRELGKILLKNPDLQIKFLAVRPQYNTTNDINMKNTLFLVVDYDNSINKGITSIHKESNGGILKSNGKQYLVIGTVGYERGNKEKQALRDILFSNDPKGPTGYGLVRRGMGKFFKEHPDERFYVPENLHTRITDKGLIHGFRVKQLESDISNDQHRSILDLINDEQRNPNKLTLEKLVFGIQTKPDVENGDGTGFRLINAGTDRYVTPSDVLSNQGRVFFFIPTARGEWMPAKIDPLFYEDINNGVLKNQIVNLLMQFTTPNRPEIRANAVKELSEILLLNPKKGPGIMTRKMTNEVSFTLDGKVVKRFNLDNNFNRQEFLEAFTALNPRINITLKVLSDLSKIRDYIEAGAFNTDIALLHTAGSSYSIHALDADGNIIKDETIGNDTPRQAANTRYKEPVVQQIYYKNKTYLYNKETGEFISNDKPVEDGALLDQLKYNQRIVDGKLSAAHKQGDWEYFILSTGEHPEVVKRHRTTKEIKVTDEKTAKETIERINKLNADEARKEAAENALKEAAKEMEERRAENINAENSGIAGQAQINPATGETTLMEEAPETTPDEVYGQMADEEASKSVSEQPIQPRKPVNTDARQRGLFKDFNTFVRGRENFQRLQHIVYGKWPDAPKSMNALEEFLKKKGIKTDLIDTSRSGVEAWLKTIRDCR